ncbi:DNA glycosylase AlkZ-like family protein [Nocardioides coralli]|uniref:DNA glycosylase AlkZ-like family protein n=1 Tax=Nocardioides coralli TaxID=2872154 RepID=UPI001CA39492|nr:crosslink repair DNA glycosylase YcaQ family protein [Nocardioides coralli]QZY30294.1 winged helix DNA-binding domain-containing protein [Nocardioides coralli]
MSTATRGRSTRGRDTEGSTTWRRALAWRLRRHLLDPVGSAAAADVVARLGAVPAMDDSLAALAVGTRSTSSRPDDLEKALADGSVIQVFAFRGAMHYLSPGGGGIYLSLRSAERQWELPSWVEHYRLSPEDWPDFRATVREVLSGGPLTLDELAAGVTARRAYRHLRPAFTEAGTLLKPLTWQGDMSLGPPRDGRRTFQRLDLNPAWVGVPDLEEAGPRAITAYLRTYGPATAKHVHYWLGEGLSAGRRRLDRWLAALDDQLVAVDVDGTTAYVVRDDVGPLLEAEPSDAVRLLPGHDQWVMGPGTKDEQITPPALRDLMTRKANPVLAGGVVSGTWSRSGDQLVVRWLAGGHPPATAIRAESDRLSGVLHRDLELRLQG